MTMYIAIVVSVGACGAALVALRRWLRWRDRRANAIWTAAMRGHTYRFEGMDETLRERSDQRRRAAAGIRGRAARLDSGSKVSDLLRAVK